MALDLQQRPAQHGHRRHHTRYEAKNGRVVLQADPIKNGGITRIGAKIGVGEDEIHAVLDVETRGGGFDSQGRPKMLFEPHVFYRELSGAENAEAVNAGLAYLKWGKRKYPRDSYSRLQKAMEINPEAALRSASWGLGQIMGFCFVNCYSQPQTAQISNGWPARIIGHPLDLRLLAA
ncbi:N-acetylmuramidase domain-containing protein [Cochlodiniinecator piscidefendens]|uniref:N-acetylmuramidase domain-containing protein n=1 Tax=Cochlodiniinecator piscidefendens TaxID=2715756 RepID=UPI00140B9616|nr:N-acetylmuramidase domain-containing protein [Cochlodiniinecator piscidefendens]